MISPSFIQVKLSKSNALRSSIPIGQAISSSKISDLKNVGNFPPYTNRSPDFSIYLVMYLTALDTSSGWQIRLKSFLPKCFKKWVFCNFVLFKTKILPCQFPSSMRKCVARDCYKMAPVVINFCWFKIHVVAPFVFFDECKLQTRKIFATSRIIWQKRKNFCTGKPPLSNYNRYSKTQTGRFLSGLKNFFNLLRNSTLQHLP